MNRSSRDRRQQYRDPYEPERNFQDVSKANWGQDEFMDAGPLNENEMKGSRQKHDREHYGSAELPNYEYRPKKFEATPEEYPQRRSLHPDDRRSYSGVGPKNYKRTDTRIEEEVCNVLMKDRNIDASNIEVNVRDGVVTLSGTVDSRMDKIEAEMVIEGIAGVQDIQNDIKLKKWGDYSDRPYQRDSYSRNPGAERNTNKDPYY